MPRSTARLLDLLETVLDRESCNLTTAARDAGLTPTTALRHLRALEARGYLERGTDGRFSAGPVMMRLAATLRDTAGIERLRSVGQPILNRLAAETGESCYLAVSDGDRATYVAAAASPRAIRHVGWVGQTVPIDSTAVGAALETPFTTVSRTGAVEPDITAVSLSPGTYAEVGVALSVLGPAHRLAAATDPPVTEALGRAAAELAHMLGLEQVTEPK